MIIHVFVVDPPFLLMAGVCNLVTTSDRHNIKASRSSILHYVIAAYPIFLLNRTNFGSGMITVCGSLMASLSRPVIHYQKSNVFVQFLHRLLHSLKQQYLFVVYDFLANQERNQQWLRLSILLDHFYPYSSHQVFCLLLCPIPPTFTGDSMQTAPGSPDASGTISAGQTLHCTIINPL
jgi:hypothetical protein